MEKLLKQDVNQGGDMQKFNIELINVIRGSSDGILRKFIRSCIHIDNYIIGDMDMLEVSGTMELFFGDVISNLKKDFEINFPGDIQVCSIFDYLYYANCERSWESEWYDLGDDDQITKNLDMIFDITGVDLSLHDVNVLSSIPEGVEPFDGFIGYRVKISGEEHLIWRSYLSPKETYKIKISKNQMIDEYTRALNMIQK